MQRQLSDEDMARLKEIEATELAEIEAAHAKAAEARRDLLGLEATDQPHYVTSTNVLVTGAEHRAFVHALTGEAMRAGQSLPRERPVLPERIVAPEGLEGEALATAVGMGATIPETRHEIPETRGE